MADTQKIGLPLAPRQDLPRQALPRGIRAMGIRCHLPGRVASGGVKYGEVILTRCGYCRRGYGALYNTAHSHAPTATRWWTECNNLDCKARGPVRETAVDAALAWMLPETPAIEKMEAKVAELEQWRDDHLRIQRVSDESFREARETVAHLWEDYEQPGITGICARLLVEECDRRFWKAIAIGWPVLALAIAVVLWMLGA